MLSRTTNREYRSCVIQTTRVRVPGNGTVVDSIRCGVPRKVFRMIRSQVQRQSPCSTSRDIARSLHDALPWSSSPDLNVAPVSIFTYRWTPGKKQNKGRRKASGRMWCISRGVDVARSSAICRAYADKASKLEVYREQGTNNCDWKYQELEIPGHSEDQARSWSGRMLQHSTSRGVRLATDSRHFTDNLQLDEQN